MLLAPTLSWSAAPKPVSPAAKTSAPAPSPTPTTVPLTDSVLVTVAAGKHSAIARMDIQGQCKRFLSQAHGRTWVSNLPLENKADDMAAVGSQDGQWIAFYSKRSGALNIWLAKSDGSAAEALTSEETDVAQASPLLREQLGFSPDSSHVAFVMHGDLWVINLKNRALVSLSSGQGVKALLWLPNSRWIAYVQGSSVKRVGPSGAPLEVLVSGLVSFPTLAWWGDSDKGSLLFLGRGLQRVNLDQKVDLLWPSLLNPNRVQVQPADLPPAKAPGGIAPSGKPTPTPPPPPEKGLVLAPLPNGSNELFLVSFTGKTRGALQVTQGGADDALFLPDGKGFLFKRQGHLWRCNLDGKQARPIADASTGAPWAGRLAPVECK